MWRGLRREETKCAESDNGEVEDGWTTGVCVREKLNRAYTIYWR